MIKVYQTIEYKNNLITTLQFKGVKVKVEFKGGNVMKNIPARLYTKDPFVQKALDESDQRGRLYRFVQELSDGSDSVTQTAAPQQPAPQQPAVPEASVIGIEAPQEEPTPGFPQNEAEAEADAGSTDDAGAQKLEFDNPAEAITYIAANWGEQVENESQACKFIEEKTGVKPIIHKG